MENTFNAANFYSPQGTKFALKLKTPVTCALNRAKFDQHIASQAQNAGATYHLGASVQSLILQDGAVKGVNLKDGTAISSKVVIDCEGISSRLLHQTGLKAFKPSGLVYGVEAEVNKVQSVEAHAVEVYLGQRWRMGFMAGWFQDQTARQKWLSNKSWHPKLLLERLMTKHPIAKIQLSGSKITHINYHAPTWLGQSEKPTPTGS